jgi:hypothetical protein
MPKKSSRPHLSELESDWDVFWKNFWNGSKPVVVDALCQTGRINQKLKLNITKRINIIIDHHKSDFKIGKTGDSYIRTDHKDYRNDYQYMYLLYRSTSSDFVSKMEELYIEKYIKLEPNLIQNKRVKAPGKKMFSYDGYYYLYIVCES